MQKVNSTGTNSNTLPRDAELQLRLADSGGAGESTGNGAGNHFLAKPEEESSFCTKRRMLVGLDVICLCVGKNRSIHLAYYSAFDLRETIFFLQFNSHNSNLNLPFKIKKIKKGFEVTVSHL